MNKGLSLNLIKYELRNAAGNIWSIVFGLVFPIIAAIVIYKGALKDIPTEIHGNFATSLYLAMAIITINSILLIGYGVNYSLDLAEKITLRLNLFGISPKKLVMGKLISQMMVFLICFTIYTLIVFLIIPVNIPTLKGGIIFIISILILCMIVFVISHGIANIFRKFGPTYAITMTIMFGSMFLSGSMGLKVENMPKIAQDIANLLPYTYISQDFYKVWIGESYNFMPFIQSMIFFGALALVILLFSFYYRRRK